MPRFDLPVDYTKIDRSTRRLVRLQYIEEQKGLCHHCGEPLTGPPRTDIAEKPVIRQLFPPNFFDFPVHLHHSHTNGLTIGAVHAYCNAVLWQYHGE